MPPPSSRHTGWRLGARPFGFGRSRSSISISVSVRNLQGVISSSAEVQTHESG
jgi:hypothetical protein